MPNAHLRLYINKFVYIKGQQRIHKLVVDPSYWQINPLITMSNLCMKELSHFKTMLTLEILTFELCYS